MRVLYLVFLILLIASCSENMIKIKASDSEKANIKEAYIRTTRIDINEENKEIAEEPKIDIISPKNFELINGSKIIVILNISSFKLVTPDKYPKKGQGHVQIWVDGMGFRGSKTEFVFENESNGTRLIKAELMLSNNTVLPYSKTIQVLVNST